MMEPLSPTKLKPAQRPQNTSSTFVLGKVSDSNLVRMETSRTKPSPSVRLGTSSLTTRSLDTGKTKPVVLGKVSCHPARSSQTEKQTRKPHCAPASVNPGDQSSPLKTTNLEKPGNLQCIVLMGKSRSTSSEISPATKPAESRQKATPGGKMYQVDNLQKEETISIKPGDSWPYLKSGSLPHAPQHHLVLKSPVINQSTQSWSSTYKSPYWPSSPSRLPNKDIAILPGTIGIKGTFFVSNTHIEIA